MKQIIIVLLIIIAALIGYGKYSQYKRYNSPELDYKSTKNIDLNYHNQEVVMNYYTAIESLNSYIAMQWSANEIDVRTPEDDDSETKIAVEGYSKILAKVKYYEALLEKSATHKEKGLTNLEIKNIENSGIDIETLENEAKIDLIKSMFDPSTAIKTRDESAFIYEVQKKLVKNGFNIRVDGIYWQETSDAIKAFEEKHQLFADGQLDAITVDLLIK